MILSIDAITLPSISAPRIGDVGDVSGLSAGAVAPVSGGFAEALAVQADKLNALHANADALAVKAATGDLEDVHDYTIAANEASLSTQALVALKNKAVDGWNEVMRMSV